MVNILAGVILVWLGCLLGLMILVVAWRVVLLAALIGLVFLLSQFKHEAESARHLTEQQAYASHIAIDRAIPKLVSLVDQVSSPQGMDFSCRSSTPKPYCIWRPEIFVTP
jgi:hypothetical protein